uniref:Uncharacterized protein n=1 Tax=Anguilla anguilla TaxID=7936 RepID=A0A0E9UVV5_ANGAN
MNVALQIIIQKALRKNIAHGNPTAILMPYQDSINICP